MGLEFFFLSLPSFVFIEIMRHPMSNELHNTLKSIIGPFVRSLSRVGLFQVTGTGAVPSGKLMASLGRDQRYW